jgi:hypothetical protein
MTRNLYGFNTEHLIPCSDCGRRRDPKVFPGFLNLAPAKVSTPKSDRNTRIHPRTTGFFPIKF